MWQKLARQTWRLTTLTACLSALTLSSLSAYTAQVPAGTKLAAKQELNLLLNATPATIDPNLLNETQGYQVVSNLFEGLTTFDAKGKLILAGATSWSVSEDGLTWTFKLRQDAKFSDGSPVTANDYVAGWQRLQDPKTGSVYTYYLTDLKVKNADAVAAGKLPSSELGVKAVDDYTLQVSLASPVPWFLDATALVVLAPIPSKLLAAGKWPDINNYVGNGAYKLVKVTLDNKEWKTYLDERRHGQYQFFVAGWNPA
ncbi:ABC transporter substrate-binding protein [Psittacicella hinzii]|uniref:Solute-binding protein family 5 domain-containing protein n=1 Tax=Psittacicella hinzii TaxID=2028575 RepID=A0A3A1YQ91_9GAMM|nr:ABC transporter substrate-binding protein [Psittacicella hinzii]RIY40463.1 hypothetical protein CKF58_00485 [Psittacicella hinzii]